MGRERKAPSEFVRDRGRGHGTCEHGIGAAVGSTRRTIYNTRTLQQRIGHKSEGEGAPVQISGDEDRYPGPYERLVSRTVEHHGSAYSALCVADVVKVRVDQCDVARVLLRGCGETEEREGRKTWTTSTREARAGFEGRVREPKRVGFKEGQCGAVGIMSGAIIDMWVAGWVVIRGEWRKFGERRHLADGRLGD